MLTNKSGIAIIGTLIFISILIMFFGKDPKDKEFTFIYNLCKIEIENNDKWQISFFFIIN